MGKFAVLVLLIFTAVGGIGQVHGDELAKIDVAWEAMAGAISYELELKPLDTAAPPLQFKTKKTQFQAEVIRGRYNFRIRSVARGGRVGSWSEAVELQAGSLEVVLKAPADGQSIKASSTFHSLRFVWEPMPEAKEYYLRVWDVNADKPKKFIRSLRNRAAVKLKVGRKYLWEVGVLTNKNIHYERKSKPFTFTLYGNKIPQPEITDIQLGRRPRIEWKTLPKTKINLQLFHRQISKGEWNLIVDEKDIEERHWRSLHNLDPGQYRIMLTATGELQGNSDPAIKEFAIKPTHLN